MFVSVRGSQLVHRGQSPQGEQHRLAARGAQVFARRDAGQPGVAIVVTRRNLKGARVSHDEMRSSSKIPERCRSSG